LCLVACRRRSPGGARGAQCVLLDKRHHRTPLAATCCTARCTGLKPTALRSLHQPMARATGNGYWRRELATLAAAVSRTALSPMHPRCTRPAPALQPRCILTASARCSPLHPPFPFPDRDRRAMLWRVRPGSSRSQSPSAPVLARLVRLHPPVQSALSSITISYLRFDGLKRRVWLPQRTAQNKPTRESTVPPSGKAFSHAFAVVLPPPSVVRIFVPLSNQRPDHHQSQRGQTSSPIPVVAKSSLSRIRPWGFCSQCTVPVPDEHLAFWPSFANPSIQPRPGSSSCPLYWHDGPWSPLSATFHPSRHADSHSRVR